MGPRASSDMDERLQVLLLGLRHLILRCFPFWFLSFYYPNRDNKPQPRKALYITISYEYDQQKKQKTRKEKEAQENLSIDKYATRT